MTRLISWNVNGLRAAEKKGFLDFIAREQADFFCLQEVKAIEGQLPPTLREVPGYHFYINSAERKGYSGTAVYARNEPLSVAYGLGDDAFDSEGRTLILEYEDFVLYNIYYPNGSSRPERLQYKLDFYEVFHNHALNYLAAGKRIIVCGDFNTAHQEIDLARPKENETSSGFLPVERSFLDRFVASGFVDTFRQFESGGGFYSWWDMKTRARERNIGWRIDYFFVSQDLAPKLTGARLMMDEPGSDHCPVVLEIDL
ncbi:MAG: exodeoxyribonuclease III [Eubacteriales bacterium]|nr:exodeoxyribonuclease III [Eubacteriales bacterium]